MEQPKFPIKIRLTGRMILMCLLFTLFSLVIGYGILFISTQTVVMEDGAPIPAFLKIFIVAAATVVEIGLLFMVVPLWQRIFGRGAMTLTENGIEDTFVIFTVFAFWTTLKIRLIPWSSLLPLEDGSGYSIDPKLLPKVGISPITRLMLSIFGFNFTVGKVDGKELEQYRLAALGLIGDCDSFVPEG